MGDLTWWLPDKSNTVSIPEKYIIDVMLAFIAHEPGHAVVAHYLGAFVPGIGIGFWPETGLWFFYTSILWGNKDCPGIHEPTVEEECIGKTAGSAAEQIYHGSYDVPSASVDLREIGELANNSTPSFDPYMDKALDLLHQHDVEVQAVMKRLEVNIRAEAGLLPGVVVNEHRVLGILPGKRLGIWLLDRDSLLDCLTPSPNQLAFS